jgi:hypothetical protein
MEIGWREVLAGAAVLFMAFLLVKLRPTSSRRGALSPEVQAARSRAFAATDLRARAEAFTEAGALAATHGRRYTVAAGFFLRAMHADPAYPGAVLRMVTVLHKRRPRLLEKILWRRLAQVPWDDAHRKAVRAMVDGLSQLYGEQLRGAARAEVMKKLAISLELWRAAPQSREGRGDEEARQEPE